MICKRGRINLFGYVTFYRDELKIKDYDKFRAYYCGLCKQLGKSFNQLVRLGLSYDFTFLALLLDSVGEHETDFLPESCFKHLGKKRMVAKNSDAVKYAADMSVAFMYFKLLDDVHDDFSVLSSIALIPYRFAYRKVKKSYGDKISSIKKWLDALSELEKEKCANIDEVSHCFASVMEVLFNTGGEDMKRLGYNIGRFIYIADAANDYEKDLKKKKYNPYIYAFPNAEADDVRKAAERSMTLTLAMAGQNYENLGIKRNKELLDNIIYMGLRKQLDDISAKSEKKGK